MHLSQDNWVDDVTWELVKRILHFGLPEAWMLFSATLLTIISSTLGMVKSLVFGILVNALIGSATEQEKTPLCSCLCGDLILFRLR